MPPLTLAITADLHWGHRKGAEATQLLSAYLHAHPPDVRPAIKIVRINLCDLCKGLLRPLQIALQEQADTIVVPPLAVLRITGNDLCKWCGVLVRDRYRDAALGDHDGRNVRNLLEFG